MAQNLFYVNVRKFTCLLQIIGVLLFISVPKRRDDGHHVPAVEGVGGDVLKQIGRDSHDRVGLSQLTDHLLDPVRLTLAQVRLEGEPRTRFRTSPGCRSGRTRRTSQLRRRPRTCPGPGQVSAISGRTFGDEG